MANLRGLESVPNPGDGVTYSGTVVLDAAGKLAVNVQGNPIYPRYADPVVVAVGDPVTVVINGTGDAVVTGRVTLQPRPAEGVVKTVPPGSPTITVTGTDGIDYTAKFADSYTPTVNDNVLLAWNASFPYVTAKVGVVAAPATPGTGSVAAPVGQAATGSTAYAATDSATWVPGLGAWDAWAGGGGRVYQGSQAGYTTYGTWFYAGSAAQLAGRTWTRIQFTLGSRRAVGSYNSPVTLHFYAHTSPNRPGGDVTRTTGPYDVVAQPGQGQTTFDLPTSFAGALAAGGGISIAGEPYAGFQGYLQEAASGLLTIDWSR
jgi:hypothetical protein